jgi:anti-anti-sigma factor
MEQEKQENVSLNVYHERAGDTCRVTAGGDIDLATVARLREAVAEAAVAAAGATTPGDAVTPPRLVLDLRAVEFMDSAGLALLVELRDRYGAESR